MNRNIPRRTHNNCPFPYLSDNVCFMSLSSYRLSAHKVTFPLFCTAVKLFKVQKTSSDDEALFCGIFFHYLLQKSPNKEYIVWHRFQLVFGIDFNLYVA